MTRVYIAVLTEGWVRYELARTVAEISHDRRYALELHFSYDRPTSSNRNGIARRFLESGADYLLMMDADTIPHRNPLDLVENDLDVVAFPYPVWRSDKSPPISLSLSTVGLETVRLGGEPLEVLWGGTGMMLIARRVLKHLEIPFEYRYDENGIKIWEEDADFCEKVRLAGFKVWSAMSHPCGHVKELDLVKVRNAVDKWEG